MFLTIPMAAKLAVNGRSFLFAQNGTILVRTHRFCASSKATTYVDVSRNRDKLQKSESSASSNKSLDAFSPPNKSFPLPGLTATEVGYFEAFNSSREGFSASIRSATSCSVSASSGAVTGTTATSVCSGSSPATQLLASPSSADRQTLLLANSLAAAQKLAFEEAPKADEKIFDMLEFVEQDCPQLIRKDFVDLFPGVNITGYQHFTVITMARRTKHDMSSWSPDVELEREELIMHFVNAAKQICSELKASGYWSDFIDPTSGRPFLGPFTSSTMFETDERYRHFGFTIDDLGCCKVILHHEWGRNAYIGVIFTSAPVCSDALSCALKNFKPSPRINPAAEGNVDSAAIG